MTEYIDREALLEDIENTLVFSGRPNHENPKQMGVRLVVQRIRCAPAADVAPVVRCSECVLSGNCTAEDTFRLVAGIENPFCCVGKRKDGEG